MTFASSGVSPGSSLHLGLILLAGFSLLLLANRIAGGRFIRRGPLSVGPAEGQGRLPVGQLLEARARGIAVEDGVEVYERLTGKLAIESLTSKNVIFSLDCPKSWISLALARAVSFLAALIGLLGLAPL